MIHQVPNEFFGRDKTKKLVSEKQIINVCGDKNDRVVGLIQKHIFNVTTKLLFTVSGSRWTTKCILELILYILKNCHMIR